MKNTVFITGASSGLGKATANLFHQNGWNVIAAMRSPENETELDALENVLLVQLDVTNPTQIQEAIAKGTEKFGSVDVLINSAGYGLMGVFEASSPEQIQQQFDVNVFGLMNVTKAILPIMRAQKKEQSLIFLHLGALLLVLLPACTTVLNLRWKGFRKL